jgi:hypothetical protein
VKEEARAREEERKRMYPVGASTLVHTKMAVVVLLTSDSLFIHFGVPGPRYHPYYMFKYRIYITIKMYRWV